MTHLNQGNLGDGSMTGGEYENMPDPSSPLAISPVGGRIGAKIEHLKLSADLSDDEIAAVRAALARHKVLFFRGQDHLDDGAQHLFAARLGKVVGHPTASTGRADQNLVEIDSHTGRVPNSWHTDMTFLDVFPEASVLRGVTVPEVGGDTMFANTAAAYRDLPEQLRAFADRSWALHTNLYDYAARKNETSEEDEEYYSKVFASTVYETEHPIVRIHPETGERCLLLGHFVKKIIGLSSVDSNRLFAILSEHITKPENVVRWRWKTNDVVIWDNRATQHSAVADFGTQRRVLRRATLYGERPISIDGERSRIVRPTPTRIDNAA